jgi:hypothetical protein
MKNPVATCAFAFACLLSLAYWTAAPAPAAKCSEAPKLSKCTGCDCGCRADGDCPCRFDANVGASVGGKIAPDGKTEIQIDLPGSQHLKNLGGSDGAGLCVFTSISHCARWAHVALLENFRDYMTKYPGGGWPAKVDQYIAKIAAEKGIPVPEYIQLEGGREQLDALKFALKTGRMIGVTYSFSPTGRYNGRRIAHMVNLVHLDGTTACVLDNNFPGETTYEWMTVEEFIRTFTGGRAGWAVILLDAGPPPLPFN